MHRTFQPPATTRIGDPQVKPNAEAPGGALLLTIEEAAAVLRMSRSRVYDLIRVGELESLKIGWTRRVTRDACKAYVRRLLASEGGDPAA
jgi:excisionase family DNA binding protein